MKKKVGIIDVGIGNIGSIINMYDALSIETVVIRNVEQLIYARSLILPGVGSFDRAMTKLNASGMLASLNDAVLVSKIPILGICVGMQIMTNFSEEGVIPGLGWIDTHCQKFKGTKADRVPNMGWHYLASSDDYPLISHNNSKFYFVHSFFVTPKASLLNCINHKYSDQRFCAAFNNGNIFGVQFHPEKSHRHGMSLLKNFAELQ